MQDSPLLVVLLAFYSVVLIVALAVVVWAVGHLKRLRLISATRELQVILADAAAAIKERSAEKLEAVNQAIEQWDRRYSKECKTHVDKVSWS